VVRRQDWSKEIFVSHSIVVHATVLIAAFVYLLIAVIGGYYIRIYGQDWGGAAQAVFLFSAAIVLLLLISSRRLRAHIRILIGKHFFNYKYDYREEWQRFIRTLARGGAGPHLLECAVQAIAQIVYSPGGKLWLRTESGVYEPVSHWEMPNIAGGIITDNSSLVNFLERWQWVIDFDEYANDPQLYQDLKMPQWLLDLPQGWLIVPLMQDIKLLGFILLKRSPVKTEFNWEDRDLLKTAGRQAAAHIAQLMATQALIEAREFQAFSKLSAFIMHDLKNLIAQLTLVVSNAARHKHNPSFMEDAISTVENSVRKMNFLIKQLRTNDYGIDAKARVDLTQLLFDIIDARSGRKPIPILESHRRGTCVLADKDRLFSVLEHVVENAQEATPADAEIRILLYEEEGWAVIEVRDNGSGMTPEFIQHRLFRPFDTTKGDAGMGIGAYQCREYVHSLGGDIEVKSQPQHGTNFIIRLPVEAEARNSVINEGNGALKRAANMK
jgi:putative PEP-CTERM system histidine kinase